MIRQWDINGTWSLWLDGYRIYSGLSKQAADNLLRLHSGSLNKVKWGHCHQ